MQSKLKLTAAQLHFVSKCCPSKPIKLFNAVLKTLEICVIARNPNGWILP